MGRSIGKGVNLTADRQQTRDSSVYLATTKKVRILSLYQASSRASKGQSQYSHPGAQRRSSKPSNP